MTGLHALLAVLSVIRADTGKKVSFTGDADLVSTSGNSSITTLHVADKLGIKLGRWLIGQEFAYTYATTSDTVSASLWHASLRGDRSLTPRLGVYLLTEFDRNTFAGFAARTNPSAGLTFTAIADTHDSLILEAGAGYTWQQSVMRDSSRDFASGRLAARYHRRLGARAAFDQALEFLPDIQQERDYRINSETSVSAPITAGIALKASYVIHYDGVPEPGFKSTDRILTTGVQVSF